jgi:type IV pilus assembly protein PilM
MFGFLKTFTTNANPIGVDFGTDCLRMAQVQVVDGEPRIVAAASADVPAHVRNDQNARTSFFVETIRDLMAQGKFKGRSAILALPAAQMYILHLRIPRMEEDALKKALPWEARGKLPIDPSQALLRHMIAGEIYQDSESKNEVILMAASRETVNTMLGMAAKAKLDVVGMNVEPMAIVDCFAQVYRRKSDSDTVSCFVDIGFKSSRAIIAQGSKILFARMIPVGGEHLNRAVAQALGIGAEEAKLLRIKLCQYQPSLDEHRANQEIQSAQPPAAEAEEQGLALLNASLSKSAKQQGGRAAKGGVAITAAPQPSRPAGPVAPLGAKPAGPGKAVTDPAEQIVLVEEACAEPLTKLVQELDLCRRYHEATFPSTPVERLVFVGGEAKQRRLCQHIARELCLAAQVGDPLVRMGRVSEVGIESGIDRRQPQPGWATAIGLSLGPVQGGQVIKANG